MDCGAASLGMICRHFGRKVSLSRIRQLCHTSTDGTSLKAICRAATELGLAARALKVSLRNLPLMPLPAIIHWEGNHWMVLYDVADTYVKVADPALGLRKIPRKEFEQNLVGLRRAFRLHRRLRERPGEQAGARLDPAFPDQVPHPLPAGNAARGRHHLSSSYSFRSSPKWWSTR